MLYPRMLTKIETGLHIRTSNETGTEFKIITLQLKCASAVGASEIFGKLLQYNQ